MSTTASPLSLLNALVDSITEPSPSIVVDEGALDELLRYDSWLVEAIFIDRLTATTARLEYITPQIQTEWDEGSGYKHFAKLVGLHDVAADEHARLERAYTHYRELARAVQFELAAA